MSTAAVPEVLVKNCANCGVQFEAKGRARMRRKFCSKSCQMKVAKKAYYEANREKIAAQKKAYQEANREKIAALSALGFVVKPAYGTKGIDPVKVV